MIQRLPHSQQEQTLTALQIREVDIPQLHQLGCISTLSVLPPNLLLLLNQLLEGDTLTAQKRCNDAPRALDLIVRAHPVPRPAGTLHAEPVLRAQVQLLRPGDADVVQAVQQGQRRQRRARAGQRREGVGVHAVGRVDEQLGGAVGVATARTDVEGDEHGRVQLERIAGRGGARDADPVGQGGRGRGAPVGLLGGEVGHDVHGVEVPPGRDGGGRSGGGDDGDRGGELQEGGAVEVVGELVRDDGGVDARRCRGGVRVVGGGGVCMEQCLGLV